MEGEEVVVVQTNTFLRIALGITFVWFGVLKLFNASPATEMIIHSMEPVFKANNLFFFALSILEISIGVLLLMNRFVKPVSVVMMGHLTVATLLVLVTQGFSPRFPILSLEGEFVVKNLVLIAAGLSLFFEKKETDIQEKI